MQCNIDAKGKSVRLIGGIINLLIGVVILVLTATQIFPASASTVGWVIGGLVTISGAFMIFEARAGWCVVRAMGFKTRI